MSKEDRAPAAFPVMMDLARSEAGLTLEQLTDLLVLPGDKRVDVSLRAAMCLGEMRENKILRYDERKHVWRVR